MASQASTNAPPLLEMRGITKRFPGVMALQDASLADGFRPADRSRLVSSPISASTSARRTAESRMRV